MLAAAIAALALGASTFEKHFTLDRQAEGPDHFYAMEPGELKDYVTKLHEIFAGLGTGVKALLPEEKAVGRRDGLHARHAIPAGKTITAEDLEVKRPGPGMRGRDFVADAVQNQTSLMPWEDAARAACLSIRERAEDQRKNDEP